MSALRDIAAIVAEKHNLTVDELRGPARERRIAWPRQEAMALTYSTKRFSTTRIGQFYERDHTTVLHAIRRVAERARP